MQIQELLESFKNATEPERFNQIAGQIVEMLPTLTKEELVHLLRNRTGYHWIDNAAIAEGIARIL
jgi:hypothetical protein